MLRGAWWGGEGEGGGEAGRERQPERSGGRLKFRQRHCRAPAFIIIIKKSYTGAPTVSITGGSIAMLHEEKKAYTRTPGHTSPSQQQSPPGQSTHAVPSLHRAGSSPTRASRPLGTSCRVEAWCAASDLSPRHGPHGQELIPA